MGLDATAVDVNEEAVRSNNEKGLRCVTAAEWDRTDGLCDVMIMSHIIEHFPPKELLDFTEHYLARLKLRGT